MLKVVCSDVVVILISYYLRVQILGNNSETCKDLEEKLRNDKKIQNNFFISEIIPIFAHVNNMFNSHNNSEIDITYKQLRYEKLFVIILFDAFAYRGKC